MRQRPAAFGVLLTLIVAAASCSVGVQYGMKLIVDTMADNDRSSRAIWKWLGLFIVLIAAESAFWRLSGWLGCVTVVKSGVDVRLDLFRHLSGHSLDYFSRHLAGSLGNRVTATAGATGAIFGTFIWKILPPCVDFIGAVVVLCTIDVRMALALIGFVAVVATFMFAFGRRARPLQQVFAARASQVGGEVVDVVSNIFTVMAFSAREREYQRLRAAFGLEAQAQRRSWLFLEKARACHDLCLWLMAGAMLIWAVEAWRAGLSEAGDVVLISALTFRILHGSRELALSLVDASQHFGVITEMLRVVAVPHEVADRPGAAPFEPGAGAIAFHDVCFAYEERRPVFEHLDLLIPAGQRLGVVGPSGAGKSTFVRLIGRVMDATRGSITVDGVDVSHVQQDSLRNAIGVVPQDITLLHRSILENLRYGNPAASDAQVHAAAREALCHDFIMALPEGYDTVVGERGARLSGGQRQRISIARAMLKNAPVLLLDEATSALDSRSEAEIQAALDRLMRGRTVVAVAHRLSTVAAFDRIVVLVDGRIVEDGAPGVLIARGGVYADLWRMQAQGQETA
ncbi:ABC transporter ATP-binding protein [Variovorax sp. J22G73]|uniref:ABC transporter ATP-binding protein n=1 Tax=unclassified Variovorax TaxID=663243 RepID=UPI0025754440|nr:MULTISPECIES: ABC transporter ATP-binding protein [unclassified Variovorax]MDM0009512.1 ABC transporter ATP-binding protein [Variovorax sp. J22R203]MDM0102020.1 ABC transporter ATP-binding protein [Variovorax sp. J22G73]